MSQTKQDEPLIIDITPETKHYAFSRGYRAGLQNKRLTAMPSSIRINQELREEYAEGWQEAQDEFSAGSSYAKKDTLIQRFIWFGATIAAGLLMAYFAIQKSEDEHPPTSAIESVEQTSKKDFTPSQEIASLSLLTNEERTALTQATEDLTPLPVQTLKKDLNLTARLLDSNNAEVSESFYFPTRNLKFELTTLATEKTQITIRWLWQRNLIQEEIYSLTKTQPAYSQQSMTKSRQGKWEIEVLDQKGKLIYLYGFNFEPNYLNY